MRLSRLVVPLAILVGLALSHRTPAQEKKARPDADPVKKLLEFPSITPRTTLNEVQEYLEARIPKLDPEKHTAESWAKESDRLRKLVLERVVFRGEAAKWRDAKGRVEEVETVAGDGYKLVKLRYEIAPGFWVPALLYVPEKLAGKVPVMLAVNGHDRAGKAAPYKQIRCTNLAKRGVIVLNAEWLGMGQLAVPGNQHGAMNQLDLCGTSGLSLFYLNMARGLDVLLAHPNADPNRVAVSGLSGGGWQTIFISSLDTRVTLSNPVAGYSSFFTRVRHFKDLGDSEQTPTDLATVADYAHLTAMRAPRPTLLTYNAKDNCCFEAGYALPPLVRAAEPFFKLNGAEKALRTHVNEVPGDHNFGLENREALYKMIGDFFFPDDKAYSAKEIDVTKEVRKGDDLKVALPDDNLTTNAVALKLAADLPRGVGPPANPEGVARWRAARAKELAIVARVPESRAVGEAVHKLDERGDVKAEYRAVKMSREGEPGEFSVPIVDLNRDAAKGTVIVVADGGRAAASDVVAAELKAGNRVIAADLYYFGECRPPSHDWLWSLMLATVGDRPIGIQAGQLAALARWATPQARDGGVRVVAVGPRTSTIALLAAATEGSVAALELHDPLGSLKEVIEQNKAVQTMPELFCFGLLQHADVADLAAVVAPRPVVVRKPSDRAKKEFARLADVYKLHGKEFDPLR